MRFVHVFFRLDKDIVLDVGRGHVFCTTLVLMRYRSVDQHNQGLRLCILSDGQ